MDQLKAAIARGVLETLFLRVPAHEARVATFGGQGVEAGVWKELGIQPENGWLIERNKKAQRRLMQFPFQIHCSNLSRFPSGIREKRGTGAGLDLFHWDLSGTVESASKELPPILPLLLQGTEGLLGVTYADSRFNTSLKEHETMKKVAQRIFGEDAFTQLYVQLVALYQQEPVEETDTFVTSAALREKRSQNTALREIGALLHLLFACASLPGTLTVSSSYQTPIEALHQLLSKQIELRQFWRVLSRTRLSLQIELVQRAVYISRYSDFSKRMRFFLFRLSRREGESALLTKLAPALAKQFLLSPCRYLHGETDLFLTQHKEKKMERTPLTGSTAETPTLEHPLSSAPQEPRVTSRAAQVDAIMADINPMLAFLSPDFARHVQALSALAREPVTIMSEPPVLQQIRKLLADGTTDTHMSSGVVSESTTSAASTDAPATPRKPKSGKRRDADSLTMEQKDDIRLTIISAVAAAKADEKTPEQVERVRASTVQKLASEHGLGRAVNRANIFGGILARGSGGYRPGFVKRVIDRLTTKKDQNELLKKLACYWGVEVRTLQEEIASIPSAQPDPLTLAHIRSHKNGCELFCLHEFIKHDTSCVYATCHYSSDWEIRRRLAT